MAAPTPTARQSPAAGAILNDDGLSTKITFSSVPTLQVWEKELTALGVEGGEPIPISNMFNAAWHTFAPRTLKKLKPIKVKAFFDINAWPTLLIQVNKKQVITLLFPNGATLCFFGFLYDLGEPTFVEGQPAMVDASIVPTNWDHTNNVEAAPVFASGSGTL